MQIVHVKDLSRLIGEGLIPVHPTQVAPRLREILRPADKVEVVEASGSHVQTAWVTRVNASGTVEVCAVHTYCEVTTPHEPFLWRFMAFESGGATLLWLDVCVALVGGLDALRESSSQQLYQDLFRDAPTTTSLLKLDLSTGKVPSLARDVLGVALQLAP